MKHFLISMILLLCGSEVYSQNGWVFLNPPGSGYLTDIQFVNTHTGFVARFSANIIKTTNAGSSFDVIPVPAGSNLNAIQFPNSLTGFAVGLNGRAIKSTNGGLNWFLLNTGLTVDIVTLSFLTSDIGYIAGYNTKVLYTSNGGANWVDRSIGQSINIISAFFTSQNTGFVGTAHESQLLFKTTNGGVNWNLQNIPYVSLIFVKSIHFINSNTGYFVGDRPYVFRTTNSGLNWDAVYAGAPDLRFLDVHFSGNDTGYAVGERVICKTINGGLNWVIQNGGTSPYFNSVYFTSPKTGYTVTTLGQILKTTTGGGQITGANLTTEALPEKFELEQNYPNPFNPVTKIRFGIPSNVKRESSDVTLIIFDILGRKVTTLVNEKLKSGTYEADWDASAYPSGVYFYRLQTESFTQTMKMVLIK